LIGLDTSFLVGLTIREHPAHARCWELFESEIRGREVSAGLSSQVLTEFMHVITDPRRFSRPLSMPDALAIAKEWWQAVECQPVSPSEQAVSVFLGWMSQHRLGRKRLLDTMLAASYYSAGIHRIATTNWRDFRIFGVFELIELD
jgi:predicted nucleic acid-binding protein